MAWVGVMGSNPIVPIKPTLNLVPSTLVKSSVLKHDDIGSNPTRAQHRAFGSDCQAMLFYGTGQLK